MFALESESASDATLIKTIHFSEHEVSKGLAKVVICDNSKVVNQVVTKNATIS